VAQQAPSGLLATAEGMTDVALTPAQVTAYIYGAEFNPDLAGSPPPPTAVSGTMVEWEELDEYMKEERLAKVRMPVGKYLHSFYCLVEDVAASTTTPLYVGVHEGTHHWLYQDRAYNSTDSELTPEDVLALINEAANRRRLRLEKAHALQAMTEDLDQRERRQAIPQDAKIAVWRRDGGRCVECGSNELLEFDHIIPLAMGGANTMRNLQLLCESCNNRKGATLG
jgi:hypothetical protein